VSLWLFSSVVLNRFHGRINGNSCNKAINSSLPLLLAIVACFFAEGAPENYLFGCRYCESLLKATTLLAALMALRYTSEIDFRRRSMLMLSLLGSLALFSSNNFISFYVSIELITVPLYFLLKGKLKNHSFFIYGISFSCIFIAAALLICCSTGFTKFNDIRYALSFFPRQSHLILFASTLMLLSFCAKLGVSFGHSYIFDVLEDSNLFAALCISRMSILISVYKVLSAVLYYTDLSTIIITFACIMILHGCIFLTRCNSLRKIFCYAYIGHSGMIMLGSASKNYDSITGVIFTSMSDLIFMLSALFLLVGIKKNRALLKNVQDLESLSFWSTESATAVSVLIASVFGVLPLTGLCGKFYICLSLIEKGLYFPVIVMAFSLLTSTFFAARLLDVIWFKKLPERGGSFFVISGRFIYIAPYLMAAAIPLAYKISSLLRLELYFMR
jgi:NADH-quinone oxidoreductase subunit N